MQVGLLNIPQKELIANQEYAPDCYFNPIQDINNNWIISTQEINQCVNPLFQFVKNIPLIEYEPK